MEVFHKYVRRLILNNAPHIWSSGRTYTESTGNYGLLVLEMQKITQDPRQAPKIAESVEFGEGEIFKDFDLSTFMDHFKLNAPAKIALASAFRKSSKLDLRTKGRFIHYTFLYSTNPRRGRHPFEQSSKLRQFPRETRLQ